MLDKLLERNSNMDHPIPGWESGEPKGRPQLGSATVWTWPHPFSSLIFPGQASGETYSKALLYLYVCPLEHRGLLLVPWLAGVSLWTQCALNDAGLLVSCCSLVLLFPSQERAQNIIAPQIGYAIFTIPKSETGHSVCEENWSSAKFRKCWIWGMKNWIASGKTMCWTGLLFT